MRRTQPEQAADEGYPAPLTVGDVMQPRPPVIDDRASVTQAAELMAERSVPAVVVQVQGKPACLLTQREIAVDAVGKGKDPRAMTAAELCGAGQTLSVGVGDPAGEALRTMRASGVDCLMVLDDGQVVGLVTIADVDAAGAGTRG